MKKMLFAALLLAATPAAAQQTCAPAVVVKQIFEREHGEVPVVRGTIANGQQILEILVARDGKWSLIVTTAANGRACLVALGDGFKVMQPPADKGDGS